MKISLPTASDEHFAGALEIAERLRSAGYEVYLAGGCVRDLVLGQAPKDYDVVTDAHPQQVAKLFRRTVLVGASFGVIRVMLRGDRDYEVATYRREADYADGRHPTHVEYSTRKEEDVERRDFTINALLLEPASGEVIDLVGGLEDLLQKRVIRAVGDPALRFREDRLRMLRAVRFAARLGYAIEPGTFAEIMREAPDIVLVSVERVVSELGGIFLSKDPPRGLDLLVESGLFPYVVPFVPFDRAGRAAPPGLREELARLPSAEISEPGRELIAWALVMARAEGDLEAHLRKLKMSRSDLRYVHRLVSAQALLREPQAHPEHARVRLAVDPDYPLFRAFAAVRFGLEALAPWRAVEADLDARPLPSLPLVTGEDLKALGIAPGPAYKVLLGRAEEEIFERRLAAREDALAFVKALAVSSGFL